MVFMMMICVTSWMFYGVHDDDLCDLLLSHFFDVGDGEKPMPPEVAGSAARRW